MDTTIGGELARLRIQDLISTAERSRLTRRPRNTRRPRPKGQEV